MSSELIIYSIGFAVSFFVSGTIYLLSLKYNLPSGNSFKGPQKIHYGVVPRIGGIAIMISILVILSMFWAVNISLFALFTVAATPAFAAGILEDFTNSVSSKARLVASLASGCLFCWLTGYKINSVEIYMVDCFLEVSIISFFLTSLAIAALVNAINVIDGLNGLASATVIIMIASFGVLAERFDDTELSVICFSIAFVCLGFLILNFPLGKIFLGDGGAYFLGALVAGIAVILPERNNEINAFSSLLIVIYPFYELVRSTMRRTLVSWRQPLEADDKHLHSLIFKFMSTRCQMARPIQNSLASAVTMILPLLSCFCALIFADDLKMLIVSIIAFIFLYEIVMAALTSTHLKNCINVYFKS